MRLHADCMQQHAAPRKLPRLGIAVSRCCRSPSLRSLEEFLEDGGSCSFSDEPTEREPVDRRSSRPLLAPLLEERRPPLVAGCRLSVFFCLRHRLVPGQRGRLRHLRGSCNDGRMDCLSARRDCREASQVVQTETQQGHTSPSGRASRGQRSASLRVFKTSPQLLDVSSWATGCKRAEKLGSLGSRFWVGLPFVGRLLARGGESRCTERRRATEQMPLSKATLSAFPQSRPPATDGRRKRVAQPTSKRRRRRPLITITFSESQVTPHL